MSYRVVINKEACISSGHCMGASSTGFTWDDGQLAAVLPGASDIPKPELRAIANACPGQAIELYDQDGRLVEL